MPDIEYISAEGLETLRAEHDHLVRIQRPEIAERINQAASLGDLSENADYEDAKRQQAFLEGRIALVESLIRNAVVIGENKASKGTKASKGKAHIGSTVTIKVDGTNETYTIVGGHEAKPDQGRVSNESPLGKAILSKSAGETGSVHSPSGEWTFEVIQVD